MSRLRSIWLVARREIIERGRSRGFVLSVLFTTAARRRLDHPPEHPVQRRRPDQRRVRRAGTGRASTWR